MKRNIDIDCFRAVLISLVILVHVVNFGNLYPLLKNSILAFIMPAFLVITGYLVDVDKPLKKFSLYLLRIFLPYLIMVLSYSILSLYLPVRDGIEVFDVSTITYVLFVKSIGPYWFLHTMMVCGILYYISFRLYSEKLSVTARYSIFASLLIIVSLFTPILNIKSATYYFIGVGIRLYFKDFSCVYIKNFWPIVPFVLLLSNSYFHDWGAISIVVCVISFFSFVSKACSFLSNKSTGMLEYIGRNTLPIYIFHPIFTMLAKFTLPVFAFEPTGILHAFSVILVGIPGCICIAKFMDITRLSYVFFRNRILR